MTAKTEKKPRVLITPPPLVPVTKRVLDLPFGQLSLVELTPEGPRLVPVVYQGYPQFLTPGMLQ